MSIFLKQEVDIIQIVIALVDVMLKDLLLAIEGVIIMSEVILPIDSICICTKQCLNIYCM